ncbi:MAG TPA: hotdog domain-containing protein [Acidimicrobiales bacterium]|nr:hotdog domain-containing protein [Acidimicrobiales bacterium]
MPAEPGLAARVTMTVTEADTAESLRCGEVAVLATPRVIALAEEATVQALLGVLPADETSVGMRIQLDHLAPAAVGTEVRADATLEKVEGRRLVFTVSISDDRGLIAAGKITRVVVDRDKFLDKAH